MSLSKPRVPIQSTAGAIPMKNEKGEVTMEKVKVSRYVSGKRPEYAAVSSDDDEDELELNLKHRPGTAAGETLPKPNTEAERDDRRLRRLQERQADDDNDYDRLARRRRLHEPEMLGHSSGESSEEEEGESHRRDQEMEESSEEEEEELDEDEIERRRANLREKARRREEDDHELMDVEEEEREGSDAGEQSSEYEEYTDSEEEETGPRLKPVFVRKKDRITIQEKQRAEQKLREQEVDVKRAANDRRKQTLIMVEQEVRKELEKAIEVDGQDWLIVNTDDENEEEEYETWKIRELKRIKRDREEKESLEKERAEADRLHNMTEEERRDELKRNPKKVTNKATKGKYRFLQKYFHRGAFFLDEEDTVYKRDFSMPTLEDHFDKTVLPKVMQVKNFGRSGRTKYTHLVDQDTTDMESPWIADTATNLKFHMTKGGGTKQTFDKPTTQKNR